MWPGPGGLRASVRCHGIIPGRRGSKASVLSPHYALAEQVKFIAPGIVADYITYPSPKGNGTVHGYLALPAKLMHHDYKDADHAALRRMNTRINEGWPDRSKCEAQCSNAYRRQWLR